MSMGRGYRRVRMLLPVRNDFSPLPRNLRPHPFVSVEQGDFGDHLRGRDAPGELGASRDQEAEHEGVDRARHAPVDRLGDRTKVEVLSHGASLGWKPSVVPPLHSAGFCSKGTLRKVAPRSVRSPAETGMGSARVGANEADTDRKARKGAARSVTDRVARKAA